MKIKAKPTCNICHAVYTCIHDTTCEHGITTNRESCVACQNNLPPTAQEAVQQRITQYADEYNEWRRKQHLSPLPRPFPKKKRSVNLSDEAWRGFYQIAADLGYVHDSTRNPNPTAFLEALGQGLLMVRAI